HHEFDDIKRIGAQVVHEGRVAVHLALIDAQLLDNNLLHLLLNCHDSSWDFVNALILAAFAEFPQVAASCPTPHSAISSRILPERLAATLASWGSLVSCARPGGYPFTGATGALGNPRAGCRPAPRTHFTMRFPKTDDTLAAGESGLEPADGRERYVRTSSARKGTLTRASNPLITPRRPRSRLPAPRAPPRAPPRPPFACHPRCALPWGRTTSESVRSDPRRRATAGAPPLRGRLRGR